jgi:hypothetical protein
MERRMLQEGIGADLDLSRAVAAGCIRQGMVDKARDIFGIVLDCEPDNDEGRQNYLDYRGITSQDNTWTFGSLRLGQEYYDVQFSLGEGTADLDTFEVGTSCVPPMPLLFNALYKTYTCIGEENIDLDTFRAFMCTNWRTSTTIQFLDNQDDSIDVLVNHLNAPHLNAKIRLPGRVEHPELPWHHQYHARQDIQDRTWLLAKQQDFSKLGGAESLPQHALDILKAGTGGPSDEAGSVLQYILSRSEQGLEDAILPRVLLDLQCEGCYEGHEGHTHYFSITPRGYRGLLASEGPPLSALILRKNEYSRIEPSFGP